MPKTEDEKYADRLIVEEVLGVYGNARGIKQDILVTDKDASSDAIALLLGDLHSYCVQTGLSWESILYNANCLLDEEDAK